MRSLVSGVLILLLAAGPLTAQTNEWKRYKNTDGQLCRPVSRGTGRQRQQDREWRPILRTLLAGQDPGLYTVVYTTMTSAQTVDEATFQVFKSAVFKELPKCDVGTERPAAHAIEGYIGHGYRLSCDMPNTRVIIVGNLYWGKHDAYAVMTMFPASADEPAAATNKFVESFAVIDPAK